MQTPVLIAGPTASGKSALALDLAQRLGGVIINCDSMQIYDGLRVLTARPSAEEEAAAPHLLYGVLPASERCSAGRYGRLAADALAQCANNGRRPIFVGGTGLYFRALTDGLSPIPSIDPAIRQQAQELIADQGTAAMLETLQARDPETAATLRASDPQRIQRAWEVLQSSGKGLAAWQKESGRPVIDGAWTGFVMMPDRAWLYRRCDRRFTQMLDEGALAEVEQIMALDLDPSLPAMKAIGVRELASWQAGQASREEAVGRAQMLTRRYAKRQLTWMRNQMPGWSVLDPSSGSVTPAALAALDADT